MHRSLMWKVVLEFLVVEIHDIARFLLEEVDALLLWHLFQVVPVAYSGFKIGANLGVLGEIGILRVFFAARLLNGRLALLLLPPAASAFLETSFPPKSLLAAKKRQAE